MYVEAGMQIHTAARMSSNQNSRSSHSHHLCNGSRNNSLLLIATGKHCHGKADVRRTDIEAIVPLLRFSFNSFPVHPAAFDQITAILLTEQKILLHRKICNHSVFVTISRN